MNMRPADTIRCPNRTSAKILSWWRVNRSRLRKVCPKVTHFTYPPKTVDLSSPADWMEIKTNTLIGEQPHSNRRESVLTPIQSGTSNNTQNEHPPDSHSRRILNLCDIEARRPICDGERSVDPESEKGRCCFKARR
jgi:hypothetical protein